MGKEIWSRTKKKMTKLELYTDAMLTCDLPEHRLRRGDIVKLVEQHTAPDGTEGYSIEVFNAVGDTIAVTAVAASALEPLREDEILCARVTWEVFHFRHRCRPVGRDGSKPPTSRR